MVEPLTRRRGLCFDPIHVKSKTWFARAATRTCVTGVADRNHHDIKQGKVKNKIPHLILLKASPN